MKTDGRVDFLLKQINDSLMKRADNDIRTGGLTSCRSRFSRHRTGAATAK